MDESPQVTAGDVFNQPPNLFIILFFDGNNTIETGDSFTQWSVFSVCLLFVVFCLASVNETLGCL